MTVILWFNTGNAVTHVTPSFKIERDNVIIGRQRFPMAGIARIEVMDGEIHTDKPVQW